MSPDIIWGYKGLKKSVIEINNHYVEVPRWGVNRYGKVNWLVSRIAKWVYLRTEQPQGVSLPLAFMPGFGCNLDCPYCYQKLQFNPNRKPSMKIPSGFNEIAARFVADYAAGCGYESVDISVLGGEPLLYWISRVDPFLEAVKSKIDISSLGVITNATLVNLRMMERLAVCGVTFMQITIDGPEKLHDKYRHFKDGSGSFDRVMRSLSLVQEYGISINIRVNVTSASLEEIPGVLSNLADSCDPSRASITFSIIDDTWNFTDSDWKWESDLGLISELYREASQIGFKAVPETHVGGCLTCSPVASRRGIVLASNGKLYSCWDSAGQQGWEVGDIDSGFTCAPEDQAWVQCGFQAQRDPSVLNEIRRAGIRGIYA